MRFGYHIAADRLEFLFAHDAGHLDLGTDRIDLQRTVLGYADRQVARDSTVIIAGDLDLYKNFVAIPFEDELLDPAAQLAGDFDLVAGPSLYLYRSGDIRDRDGTVRISIHDLVHVVGISRRQPQA